MSCIASCHSLVPDTFSDNRSNAMKERGRVFEERSDALWWRSVGCFCRSRQGVWMESNNRGKGRLKTGGGGGGGGVAGVASRQATPTRPSGPASRAILTGKVAT